MTIIAINYFANDIQFEIESRAGVQWHKVYRLKNGTIFDDEIVNNISDFFYLPLSFDSDLACQFYRVSSREEENFTEINGSMLITTEVVNEKTLLGNYKLDAEFVDLSSLKLPVIITTSSNEIIQTFSIKRISEETIVVDSFDELKDKEVYYLSIGEKNFKIGPYAYDVSDNVLMYLSGEQLLLPQDEWYAETNDSAEFMLFIEEVYARYLPVYDNANYTHLVTDEFEYGMSKLAHKNRLSFLSVLSSDHSPVHNALFSRTLFDAIFPSGFNFGVLEVQCGNGDEVIGPITIQVNAGFDYVPSQKLSKKMIINIADVESFLPINKIIFHAKSDIKKFQGENFKSQNLIFSQGIENDISTSFVKIFVQVVTMIAITSLVCAIFIPFSRVVAPDLFLLQYLGVNISNLIVLSMILMMTIVHSVAYLLLKVLLTFYNSQILQMFQLPLVQLDAELLLLSSAQLIFVFIVSWGVFLQTCLKSMKIQKKSFNLA